jgi:hypothetical protein
MRRGIWVRASTRVRSVYLRSHQHELFPRHISAMCWIRSRCSGEIAPFANSSHCSARPMYSWTVFIEGTRPLHVSLSSSHYRVADCTDDAKIFTKNGFSAVDALHAAGHLLRALHPKVAGPILGWTIAKIALESIGQGSGTIFR